MHACVCTTDQMPLEYGTQGTLSTQSISIIRIILTNRYWQSYHDQCCTVAPERRIVILGHGTPLGHTTECVRGEGTTPAGSAPLGAGQLAPEAAAACCGHDQGVGRARPLPARTAMHTCMSSSNNCQ